MKKKIVKGLIEFGLLIAFVTVFANQTTKAQRLDYGLRANIPFAFTVGNQTMPAGRYSFERAEANDSDFVLRVSSLTARSTTFHNTVPVTTQKPRDKGILIFHRYGDHYFLFQVWSAAALTGRSLPRSRSERDIQRKNVDAGLSATRGVESQVVTIVAY